MKFNETFTIVKKRDTKPILAIVELKDYKFEGLIEFTNSPTFVMNLDHLVLMNIGVQNEEEIYLKRDNELIPVTRNDVHFLQVSKVILSHKFSLQSFFDKHGDARCIVFYTAPTSGSIFHEGYTIRVAVITDELIKQKLEASSKTEEK